MGKLTQVGSFDCSQEISGVPDSPKKERTGKSSDALPRRYDLKDRSVADWQSASALPQARKIILLRFISALDFPRCQIFHMVDLGP